MIYETINNAKQLRDRFIAYSRDNFSYEAYEALFDYFDEIEYELDVIAIDCDFVEATTDKIRADYDLNDNTDVEEFLQDNTIVMKLSNGDFLYQLF